MLRSWAPRTEGACCQRSAPAWLEVPVAPGDDDHAPARLGDAAQLGDELRLVRHVLAALHGPHEVERPVVEGQLAAVHLGVVQVVVVAVPGARLGAPPLAQSQEFRLRPSWPRPKILSLAGFRIQNLPISGISAADHPTTTYHA